MTAAEAVADIADSIKRKRIRVSFNNVAAMSLLLSLLRAALVVNMIVSYSGDHHRKTC